MKNGERGPEREILVQFGTKTGWTEVLVLYFTLDISSKFAPRPTFQAKCLDYGYWDGEDNGDSRNGKDDCNRAYFKTIEKNFFHSTVIKGSSSEAVLPAFLVWNAFY